MPRGAYQLCNSKALTRHNSLFAGATVSKGQGVGLEACRGHFLHCLLGAQAKGD